MTYVNITQKDRISVISICHENRMNALESQVRDELLSALSAFGRDPQSRVAVLTGRGKAFCAGGSLNDFADGMSADAGIDYMKGLNEIILAIRNLEKPVIAAVNGAAVGAGVSLALACDIVIAAESAVFALAFARVGLVPDLGGIYFLPRIVGLHKAKELYFTGDTLTAQRALEMGFVNRVTPQQDLLAEATKMAGVIAQGPPRPFALGKRLLNRSDQLSLEDALTYETLAQSVLFQSNDHAEGLAAFREKRAPNFIGK